MTRSFDRRGGATLRDELRKADDKSRERPDWTKRRMPTIAAGVDAKRKEDDLSLDLDCMCENNDPDCATCWEPVAQHAAAINHAGLTATRLPPDQQFDCDVRYRFDECLELLLRKHADYGPSNIGNAPGGPLNGLRVRMHDKLARINHLYNQEGNATTPQFESMRDSLADLANYAIIGLMVLDGTWPTE